MNEDQIPEAFNTPELRAAYLDTSKVHRIEDCIAEEDLPRFLKWRRTQKALDALSSPVIKLRKLLRHTK